MPAKTAPRRLPFLSSREDPRRTYLAAILLLSACAAAMALVRAIDPAHAQNAPAADAPATAAGAAVAADSVAVKWIPDQRALVDTPPLVIDLSETFAAGYSGDRAAIAIGVILNTKEKVAAATIDGQELHLDCKKIGSTEVTIEAQRPDGKRYRSKFIVNVWEPDYWQLAFIVVGGLGLFLLGMKNLSSGLQAIAGNGLRRMISLVTDNRLLATGVGTLVTMILQSSSITTVMVVGFVNSGFMTLSQAVGVIMGANIGTTITGWTLALNIGKYGLPMAGFGAFGFLFARRESWRFLSMSLMGLGMVFFGLELMKDGFTIVKDLPAFEAWFHQFHADSYFGVLKCALVGCIVTCIVQSSSATLGITIGLAQIGVIPFETAGALVLGENIGTTITAWLASFGANTHAKRAAYFHVLFNVLGVMWITAIFTHLYLPGVKAFLGFDEMTTENVTVGIAAVHSGFNIINTIVFLPIAGYLARFLERIVPEKAFKEKPHLTALDVRILETPAIAIEQSRVEVLRMGHSCEKMLSWTRAIVTSKEPPKEIVDKVFHREEVLDTIYDEIAAFTSHLMSENATHHVVEECQRQLRMADEYESVSDYVMQVAKSHLKLLNSHLEIPESGRKELLEIHDAVADYLSFITTAFEQRQRDILTKAKTRGDALTHKVKEIRDAFLERMSAERLDPLVSTAFNAQLNAYRRVRDHVMTIAEAIAAPHFKAPD